MGSFYSSLSIFFFPHFQLESSRSLGSPHSYLHLIKLSATQREPQTPPSVSFHPMSFVSPSLTDYLGNSDSMSAGVNISSGHHPSRIEIQSLYIHYIYCAMMNERRRKNTYILKNYLSSRLFIVPMEKFNFQTGSDFFAVLYVASSRNIKCSNPKFPNLSTKSVTVEECGFQTKCYSFSSWGANR